MDLFYKWMARSKSAPDSMVSSNPSPKTLQVSDFITAKNIALFPPGLSKHQILRNLVRSLDLPKPDEALQAILEREAAGQTRIAPRLALPHARIQGLRGIRAAIGICPPSVLDVHIEGGPIHLFVLFLGPTDSMKEHLAFLAGVSALFQMEGLTDALLKLDSPEAVLEEIRAAEKTIED